MLAKFLIFPKYSYGPSGESENNGLAPEQKQVYFERRSKYYAYNIVKGRLIDLNGNIYKPPNERSAQT